MALQRGAGGHASTPHVVIVTEAQTKARALWDNRHKPRALTAPRQPAEQLARLDAGGYRAVRERARLGKKIGS